ncbi:hypothetical protein [Chitinophaga nivalis]|uniref:Lipoprotein n=1 Tax=Chitinophaga nivalis TaxID=2991709 RepID=A0ABT3IG60_9BACT|nr:hypothetical protein [Chitinophaga nivalis]MCW3467364.1 hypothetical protein [Chitinophaga nivalis]MCW3482944.1 hypothetical protein [Chitinophaga nivalis]
MKKNLKGLLFALLLLLVACAKNDKVTPETSVPPTVEKQRPGIYPETIIGQGISYKFIYNPDYTVNYIVLQKYFEKKHLDFIYKDGKCVLVKTRKEDGWRGQIDSFVYRGNQVTHYRSYSEFGVIVVTDTHLLTYDDNARLVQVGTKDTLFRGGKDNWLLKYTTFTYKGNNLVYSFDKHHFSAPMEVPSNMDMESINEITYENTPNPIYPFLLKNPMAVWCLGWYPTINTPVSCFPTENNPAAVSHTYFRQKFADYTFKNEFDVEYKADSPTIKKHDFVQSVSSGSAESIVWVYSFLKVK